MESIENPDVASSLRVMRFKFEANDALKEYVVLQLDERKRRLASFAFYGSRQLLLTVDEYHKHEGNLQRIGKRFREFKEPIHLKPIAGSHEISEYVTRLQFVPLEQETFDTMTSLDLVKPKEDYGWDTPPIPNMITNQPDRGHYIFVDVPTHALHSERQRKMANMALTNEATTSRLWLHTQALSTVRDIHFKETTGHTTPDNTHDDDDIERVS